MAPPIKINRPGMPPRLNPKATKSIYYLAYLLVCSSGDWTEDQQVQAIAFAKEYGNVSAVELDEYLLRLKQLSRRHLAHPIEQRAGIEHCLKILESQLSKEQKRLVFDHLQLVSKGILGNNQWPEVYHALEVPLPNSIAEAAELAFYGIQPVPSDATSALT
ncbi:MAG: hypothetical protein A2508_02915 [Candidatus Lambdaproteobacteria bacterium RIFOXYD12_FULL_49_8]|uniref:Uncharacterized protein n=1 Tax=Candidatus Lambdaproteobacteria bacterium RIFOXYD2_FULL_50_16 TaxID=1817772 RepID=A0A1F6GDK7_9PROT|nr:MAG: hypothetical protein A2527_04635 [Candidatus Lambdaproteobacteria bacterium RIFOXYD2_FULL_50_16]OGG98123.1 MAG: hypothetical protein A2508_02915 [Candidatus Lambdaproteobacteria bacterium RIFOXYD12_FULL_49_8]